ncbi:MAG TPA: hypothetical protein VJK29_04610 [Terriglobales bacterium]|nr:hypothetical protein [Terriglobales bacterium]
MKRIAYVWLAGIILAGMLVTLAGAQSQSLGDYARAARKDKDKDKKQPVAKQFDNDNLPKTDKLSIVGNALPQSTEEAKESVPQDGDHGKAAAQTEKGAQTDKSAETAPKDATAEREKTYKEWQQKIADQRKQIDLLSRELDVMQREYRLRAAAFYADAGNRLRNQADWDKEDAAYKQKIAEKQKAVDAAKQHLDDLQEQARKAGVPAAMRE